MILREIRIKKFRELRINIVTHLIFSKYSAVFWLAMFEGLMWSLKSGP